MFRIRTSAAAGVLLMLTASLSSAEATAQVRLDNLSATDLFALADGARRDGNNEDAEALYDALARNPDAEIRAEARFRKGMMFADAGQYTDAALSFRALLDEKPHAVRVRLELARMLAAIGDEAGARAALRQAQASGLPSDVAATVQQFALAIRSPKQLGGTIEVAFAPDTNINRATQARTLDTVIAPLTLTRDARATSGLGLKVAGQAFAKLGLSENLSLLPRIAGIANLYRSEAFDDVSGSALIGLQWQRQRDRITPSVGQTWRWYGRRAYARTLSASVDWLRIVGPRTQLIVSGSAGRANYLLNDLQDGSIYDGSVAVERALDESSGASVTLSATRQTARDPGYSTTSGGASLLAWREVGGATVFASAGGRRTEGDARLFLFPERRREWLLTARLGATLRQLQFQGFAPSVRFSYERNISTVGIYDYQRVASEVGIVRAF